MQFNIAFLSLLVSSVLAADCRGKPNGLYSDQQCSATYYQCIGGTAYVANCPSGALFDQTKAICDLSFNCKIPTSTSSSATPTPTSNPCSGKTDGLYSHGECLPYYYKCQGGVQFHQFCNVSGVVQMVFDQNRLSCQTRTVCTSDPCSGKTDGLYSYLQCSPQYFKCQGGTASHHKCDVFHLTQMVFDQKISQCYWPQPCQTTTSSSVSTTKTSVVVQTTTTTVIATAVATRTLTSVLYPRRTPGPLLPENLGF